MTEKKADTTLAELSKIIQEDNSRKRKVARHRYNIVIGMLFMLSAKIDHLGGEDGWRPMFIGTIGFLMVMWAIFRLYRLED